MFKIDTPPCNVNTCSTYKFIDESTSTVMDPAARCSSFNVDVSFTNHQAWKAAQQNSDSCKATVAHLTSRKVPHNKPGDQHNEMRHYIRHAKLAPDGLLITTGDSITYSPGQLKNKIIVPHNVAPGLYTISPTNSQTPIPQCHNSRPNLTGPSILVTFSPS